MKEKEVAKAQQSNMKAYTTEEMSSNDFTWATIKEEIDDDVVNSDESINVTSPVKTPAAKKGELHTCEECGKTFSYVQNLQQHMRVHGGMKYNCDVCHKEFNYLQNLYQHKRTHSQEKRFKCHLCPKEFNDPANFNRHKKRIHGVVGKKGAIIPVEQYVPLSFDMPYQCHICGMAFVFEKSREDHIARNNCAVFDDVEYKPQINIKQECQSPAKTPKKIDGRRQRKSRKTSCSSASGSPEKSPVNPSNGTDDLIHNVNTDNMANIYTTNEPMYNNPVTVMTVNSSPQHVSPMMSQINHSPEHSPSMQYVSSPTHYDGITEAHHSPIQSGVVESTSPGQYHTSPQPLSPVQYGEAESTSPVMYSDAISEAITTYGLTGYTVTNYTTATSDVLHNANLFQDMDDQVKISYAELENVPTSTIESNSPPPPLVKSSSLPPIMTFQKMYSDNNEVDGTTSPMSNHGNIIPSSPTEQQSPVNYYTVAPEEQYKPETSETQLEIDSLISDIEQDFRCTNVNSALTCLHCGLAFKERSYLAAHLPECLNVKQEPQSLPLAPIMRHECAMCDAVFHDLEKLSSHENMHVSLGTIMCKLCSQTFDVLSSLRRHAIQCIRLKVERERATTAGKTGAPKRKRTRSIKSPEASKSELNGVAPYPSPQRIAVAKGNKTNRRTPLKKRQVTFPDPSLTNSPVHPQQISNGNPNVLVHRPWASPIGVTPISSQNANISSHLQQALVFTTAADNSTVNTDVTTTTATAELNNNATKNSKIIETLYALV